MHAQLCLGVLIYRVIALIAIWRFQTVILLPEDRSMPPV